MAFATNPYYSVITIDHTLVGGALTDFVLYLDDLPVDAYAEIHSTGKDIRFSDSTGVTEFAFDLRAIDTGAGTCEIMVKVPSVSAVTDTEIRIWYGDHTLSLYAASDTYGRNNVYTLFEAVYALSEETAGTTGSAVYIDRTGNGNDGSDYVSDTGTAGKIGSGQEFDGSNDEIAIPSTNFQTLTSGTVLFWAYPVSSVGTAVWSHGGATGISKISIIEIMNAYSGNFELRANMRDGATVLRDVKSTTTIPTSAWTHCAVSVDGSGIRFQVDGAPTGIITYNGTAANTSWFARLSTSANHTRIGVLRYNGINYRWFDGSLDEVWVSSAALSSNYISTLYESQDNAYGNFYTVGTKQTASAPVTFTPIICWF